MTDAVEYPDLVVVGAGLFGLTVAQQAVEHLGVRVEIIDVRDHIGGNAYSYMDEETGAEIHKYGAHLFHTSNRRVWDYVNRFTSFTDYVHRVYATHDGEVYPLPINLGTVNQFFRAHYTPAVDFPDKVQPSVATRRVEELEELCRRLHGEFCARAEGTTDEVLFESTMRGGMMFGYTGNYRRVKAPYDRSRINTICRVRLGRMDDANDLEGEIVDN